MAKLEIYGARSESNGAKWEKDEVMFACISMLALVVLPVALGFWVLGEQITNFSEDPSKVDVKWWELVAGYLHDLAVWALCCCGLQLPFGIWSKVIPGTSCPLGISLFFTRKLV